MYKVIKTFTDMQDEGYLYKVGDEFPRQGMIASKDRIDELAGKNNRQGVPLIAEERKKDEGVDFHSAYPAQNKPAERGLLKEEEEAQAVVNKKPSTNKRKKKET